MATSNLSLEKPAKGTKDWHLPLNDNMQRIEDKLTKRNAGDPSGAVTPDFTGQWLFDTSNLEWYYSTGTTTSDWYRSIRGAQPAFKSKTSNYTAAPFEQVALDAGTTLTLPASPAIGDEVYVIPYGDWESNNSTIDRNGNNISGAASNITLDLNRGFALVWTGSTWGWAVKG